MPTRLVRTGVPEKRARSELTLLAGAQLLDRVLHWSLSAPLLNPLFGLLPPLPEDRQYLPPAAFPLRLYLPLVPLLVRRLRILLPCRPPRLWLRKRLVQRLLHPVALLLLARQLLLPRLKVREPAQLQSLFLLLVFVVVLAPHVASDLKLHGPQWPASATPMRDGSGPQ